MSAQPTEPGCATVLASTVLWVLVAAAILTAFTLLVGACGAAAPA